jgi:hypothetical protein
MRMNVDMGRWSVGRKKERERPSPNEARGASGRNDNTMRAARWAAAAFQAIITTYYKKESAATER